jgi:peptide deformylase
MVARLILKYPDSKLRGLCDPVFFEDWKYSVSEWCQALRDTMVANAGLGLAAPQISIKKQIFAIDVNELDNPEIFQQEPKNGVLFFINPSIRHIKIDDAKSLEACLSVPGVMYTVKRSSTIELTYMTPDMKSVTLQTGGENAIIIQHEFDHLHGKLFVDKLNAFDRKEFKKLFEKPKKEMSDGQIRQLREQRRSKARNNRKK